MTSYTSTTYVLSTDDDPCITRHQDGGVSFHLSDYHGRGFCLRLESCHIPAVQELLAALNRQATVLAHDPKEGD